MTRFGLIVLRRRCLVRLLRQSLPWSAVLTVTEHNKPDIKVSTPTGAQARNLGAYMPFGPKYHRYKY